MTPHPGQKCLKKHIGPYRALEPPIHIAQKISYFYHFIEQNHPITFQLFSEGKLSPFFDLKNYLTHPAFS